MIKSLPSQILVMVGGSHNVGALSVLKPVFVSKDLKKLSLQALVK